MQRTIRVASLSALVGALVATPIAVYASHAFNDVPDSHTFHNDIAWLEEAAVTRGCNPPDNTEFCPDDNVTRGQMAAFMRRFAQYIDAEDGTPATADHASTADRTETLAGSTKAELAPRAAFNSVEDAPNEDMTLSAELTAPAPGVLLMSGGVDGTRFSTESDEYACLLEVNDGIVDGSLRIAELGESDSIDEEDCTTSGAAIVASGTHTVDFEVSGVGTSGLFGASVWVLWVPFDGTGAIPTEATSRGGLDDSPDKRDS